MAALSEPAVVARLEQRLGFGRRRDVPAPAVRPAALADVLCAQRSSADDRVPDLGEEQVLDGPDAAANQAALERLRVQNGTLTVWWLDRMVTTDRPFVERLTWFWHGHFATGISMVGSARLMARQNQTIRRLSTGTFDGLTAAMVVDPAMLVWLNGVQNQAGDPNENLGRELMELFVLGIGNYTEDDVKEAARALTGWVVDRRSVTAEFVAGRFDDGPKTVLGEPVRDAGSLVTMLVARPEAERFVAGRVWSHFVSAEPPPPDAVERMTRSFGTRRDIPALMRAAVAEPAFRDPDSVLVKQPVEWIVGLMRALGVRPLLLPPDHATALRTGLAALGQLPFDPPNVGGWPQGDAWLTTGAAFGRLALAGLIVRNADLTPVAAAPPPTRVATVAGLLGIRDLSRRSVDALTEAVHDPVALVTVAACTPEYAVSA